MNDTDSNAPKIVIPAQCVTRADSAETLCGRERKGKPLLVSPEESRPKEICLACWRMYTSGNPPEEDTSDE